MFLILGYLYYLLKIRKNVVVYPQNIYLREGERGQGEILREKEQMKR